MSIPTEENLKKKIQAFCFPVVRSTAHTIVVTLGFAQELDAAALAKVKEGIAGMLDISPENVDLKKASRRSVSYTTTIYFADAASAGTALSALGPNGQNIPQGLKMVGAPEPTSVSVSEVILPGGTETSAAHSILPFSAFTQMVFVSIGVICTCLHLM